MGINLSDLNCNAGFYNRKSEAELPQLLAGNYNRKSEAELPQLLAGNYNRKSEAELPLMIISYLPATLPTLAGMPTISSNDNAIIASASLSNMGMGKISRCGFLTQKFAETYMANGFELGALDGFTVSSTNAASEEIAVIDTIVTSGVESKYAVKLCSSGASQTSKIACSVRGILDFSFSWKVSSEGGYDKLAWYLDGVLQNTISGEVDWQKQTATLIAGMHTVEFTYSKDGGFNKGSDCGWIDDIIFNMEAPVEYMAAPMPTKVGQLFKADLTSLSSGISYIAAFAENAAGRVVSEYVLYRNTLGWKGGLVYDLQPDIFSDFVVGSALIPRVKAKQVIIGEATL